MNRQQAADFVRSNPDKYLSRAKRKGYICPLCGNGSGADGDGLTTKDKVHFKCFKCGFYGDMIELIAKERGIPDGGGREAFAAAFEAYGLTVDNTEYTHNTQPTHNTEPVKEKKPAYTDYSQYIADHTGEGCDYSYLKARGIREETAARLRFGYDASAQAVIIPVSYNGTQGYIKRFSTGEGMRYQVAKGGVNGLFNEAVLDQDDTPVFITEGAIDAASIEELGGQAVGLNSTNNARKLLDRVKAGCACRRFIICMDNDEAGIRAKEELLEGLKDLSLQAVTMDAVEGCKDANEALVKDREALLNTMMDAMEKATEQANDKLNEIEQHKVSSLLPQFIEYIKDAKNHKPLPTGFIGFDKAIGGGLYPRTYVIGAISTIGKTTFTLQAVDGVAENGGDVIIFSLEMMKEELLARSISREIYRDNFTADEKTVKRLARTEQEILTLSRGDYAEDQQQAVISAWKRYASYAGGHISIYEGAKTADDIERITQEYITNTGKVPVVVVDYLQILQPNEDYIRAQPRQQVDYNVNVFAKMRRELKTPIILISAFNRNSYNGVADNSSFKESGAIEYTGDCMITMEYNAEWKSGQGKDNENKQILKEQQRKDPRHIILTFQKNRGNRTGGTILYDYYPQYNYFMEKADTDEDLPFKVSEL